MIEKLKSGLLNPGIVSTLLGEEDTEEIPIFHDPFVIYLSVTHPMCERKTLSIKDIDINDMWLLTEGHCLMNQIVNLCETKRQRRKTEKISIQNRKTGDNN